MKTKDGSLSATYNDKGKLIRVVEEYKNVLPNEVIYSSTVHILLIPIVNDKYCTPKRKAMILKQYNLKIKGKRTLRLKSSRMAIY
jgi:hypothetical protein